MRKTSGNSTDLKFYVRGYLVGSCVGIIQSLLNLEWNKLSNSLLKTFNILVVKRKYFLVGLLQI